MKRKELLQYIACIFLYFCQLHQSQLTHPNVPSFLDFMVRTLRAEWGEGEDLRTHEVRQYHYLLWKDFIAPEHPTGVLSFLRRINEAYSHDQGSLLVHCR